MRKQIGAAVLAGGLMLSACLPGLAQAAKIEERPTAVTMAADAILVRPLMLLGTLAGTGIYVLSLPVSLLGDNVEEAGQKLVVTPFKATFLRCLGCTKKHVPEAEYY